MAIHKALLLLAGVLAFGQAGAQSLYKCTVNGKVTYQSMACATGGEVLPVPPPPTPEQTRAAQLRAEEARQQVEQAAARARVQREQAARDAAQAKLAQAPSQDPAQAGKPPAKPDCSALRTQREELYGQRNADRRNSNLEAMSRTQSAIDALEADYVKGKCGPLD